MSCMPPITSLDSTRGKKLLYSGNQPLLCSHSQTSFFHAFLSKHDSRFGPITAHNPLHCLLASSDHLDIRYKLK